MQQTDVVQLVQEEAWVTVKLEAFLADREQVARPDEAEVDAELECAPAGGAFAAPDPVGQVWETQGFGCGR